MSRLSVEAVLLTSEPDESDTLADADLSLLRIEGFTIPAEARQLWLDYNFIS